jgi:hypothetical protein
MSAETEALVVLGAVFGLVAAALSALLIFVSRMSHRLDARIGPPVDRWLFSKIPLKRVGVSFVTYYATVAAIWLALVGGLFIADLLDVQAAAILALGLVASVVAVAWVRQRKLNAEGLVLLKKKPGGKVATVSSISKSSSP